MESQKIKNDLEGKTFGRLKVLRLAGKDKRNKALWECECECGNIVTISRNNLIRSDIKSCGCLQQNNYKNRVYYNNLKKGYIENTNIAYLKSDKLSKANKSGCKGVYFQKKSGKWIAQIRFKKKCYYLGIFDKLEDAIKARKKAEEKLHKEFLRNLEKEHKNGN